MGSAGGTSLRRRVFAVTTITSLMVLKWSSNLHIDTLQSEHTRQGLEANVGAECFPLRPYVLHIAQSWFRGCSLVSQMYLVHLDCTQT